MSLQVINIILSKATKNAKDSLIVRDICWRVQSVATFAGSVVLIVSLPVPVERGTGLICELYAGQKQIRGRGHDTSDCVMQSSVSSWQSLSCSSSSLLSSIRCFRRCDRSQLWLATALRCSFINMTINFVASFGCFFRISTSFWLLISYWDLRKR